MTEIRPEDYVESDLDEESPFPLVTPLVDPAGQRHFQKRPQTYRELLTNLLCWHDGNLSDADLAVYGLTRAHVNQVMLELGESCNKFRALWQEDYDKGKADKEPPETFLR